VKGDEEMTRCRFAVDLFTTAQSLTPARTRGRVGCVGDAWASPTMVPGVLIGPPGSGERGRARVLFGVGG
jgi:hypothetical protein